MDEIWIKISNEIPSKFIPLTGDVFAAMKKMNNTSVLF